MSAPSTTTLVVRAVVTAVGLLVAGFFLVDWNALVVSMGPQQTDDAELRGDPSLIQAETAGLVTGVLVDDDQAVRRGQPLFRIEDDYSRVEVMQAQAERDRAAAEVTLAVTNRDEARDTVGAARKRVTAAGALLVFAREDAARWNGLRGTPGDLLRARQQANASEADNRDTVAADQDRVGIDVEQVRRLDLAIDAAKEREKSREAELALARIALRWTVVVAPEDGVITERAAYRGQYVSAGTPLTRFVPLPRVWAVAWYREEQVASMRVGQHVAIHVDAFPDLRLEGCVQSVGPYTQSYDEALPPDQSTGNFTKVVQRVPIKITYPEPTDPVLVRGMVPGLSVETRVRTDLPADCVPVPGL